MVRRVKTPTRIVHPPADLGRDVPSIEFILNRADGYRPSEYRREIWRTLRHRSWWEAAYLVAKYCDEVVPREPMETSTQALMEATGLSRASVHRYLSTGRVIVRRVALAADYPIPIHWIESPPTIGWYVEALRAANRLKLDAVNMVISLESFEPALTAAEIKEKTESLTKWRKSELGPRGGVTHRAETPRTDRMLEPWPTEVSEELDWSFVSVDGFYRAAQGKSEPAVGSHWTEVTGDAPVILDGVHMTAPEAWVEMLNNASGDMAGLPMHLAWPEIENNFTHRPEASGLMEVLCFSIRLGGNVAGFLVLDFHDPARLQEVRMNSYRQIRNLTRPLIERFERQFAGGFDTKTEVA